MPLGIHFKHYSLIYEENLLIQEIILFEIVKKKIEILIIFLHTAQPIIDMPFFFFLCKWVFNVGGDD